jgi:hypothetical protein
MILWITRQLVLAGGSIVCRFYYWLEASPKGSSLERFLRYPKKKILFTNTQNYLHMLLLLWSLFDWMAASSGHSFYSLEEFLNFCTFILFLSFP